MYWVKEGGINMGTYEIGSLAKQSNGHMVILGKSQI